MSTAPRTFFTLNLNTLLNGVITAIAIAVLSNGYAINKSVIELSAQVTELNRKMQDIMPRAELEARFKGIEAQFFEIKQKQQLTETELIRLRESRR